jgi:membrane associated rhomboid family serine protease
MLISFPVDYNKYSNRFPWAIVLLAVILSGIYFTCQVNDQYNQKKAFQYYFQSKLYQLELPAYIDYLTKKPAENILKPQISPIELYWFSRGDNEFQQLLSENKIIPTTHPFYWEWYTRHRSYQYLLTLDSTNVFGFKSALPTITDAFTSIFLHGSFIHLLGNIIFLFFIGRYVEVCIGGGATLISFVVLGMGSVGMYYLLTPPTLYPLVGASGAIAGLMGFFCILYQAEKLLFFVNVFFFSGMFRFNPIILLPVWIGWEFLQNVWLQTEEVAYTAHIGGVFLGAVVGIILKRVFPSINPKRSNPKHQEFQELYAQAMFDLTNLDFPKAKKLLLKLHENFPEERVVLYKLFFILKLEPKSEKYKEIVEEIMKLRLYDPDELAIQLEVKNHYDFFTSEARASDLKR